MSPTERASLRELTNACIRAVQIATERSRVKHAWARLAWEALTDAERVDALAACAQAKGDAIEANNGLIESVVRQWRGVESDIVERGDLRGAAQEGYLRSLEGYDVEGKTEHTTYAVQCMTNAILRMVYEMQPWAQSSNVTRAQQAARSFTDAYKRDHGGARPSAQQIAAGTGFAPHEVKFALSIPVVVSGDGHDDEDREPELERVASDDGLKKEAANIVEAVSCSVGREQAEALADMTGVPIVDAIIRAAHDAALAV